MNISGADALVQFFNDSAAAGATMLTAGRAVPAARNRRKSKPAVRRAAYLEFQAAAWDAVMRAQNLVTVGNAAYKPLIVSGLWNGQSKLVDAAESTGLSVSRLLAAVTAVRLVGSPELREIAETITVAVGTMLSTLPSGGRSSTRARREEGFEACKKLIGQKQKDFTTAARLDLGYAAKQRRHRWQLWRPKTAEAWPGGWPGPQLPMEAVRAAPAESAGAVVPGQRSGTGSAAEVEAG